MCSSHILRQHSLDFQLSVQRWRVTLSYHALCLQSSSHHTHINTGVGHFISPSPALCLSPPLFLFLINIAKPLNSWSPLSSFSSTVRAAKGKGIREKLPIEAFGMDSLQTAFSFCSCDGLALSWLQMRFAFLILHAMPGKIKPRHRNKRRKEK